MTDLVVRQLRAGEEDLFLSFRDSALVGVQSIGRDYRELLAAHQYRPEWTYVALRGDRVVGRAAWWGGPDDAEPKALDWFDFGNDDGADLDAGVALLAEATLRAEYVLLLSPGWRNRADERRAGELRIAAAERAGMTRLVERLHYTWTPAAGSPDRPNRLRYRQEPDDDVLLDAFRRVHSSTLDAHALRTTAEHGLDAAAHEELDFVRWCPSPREWWRLAYTPAGELVGITGPARNHGGPIVGFVGVVPEQRGHGYGYDLLAEATHLLVAEGASAITAETDATNTPMARTFRRAGYPITQERVYLVWPQR